jgi:signal transduction histidine kinase
VTADVGSIGLGLFISRELAQLMGGSLVYDHDGSLSRFRLTLPAGVNDSRAAPVLPPMAVPSS